MRVSNVEQSLSEVHETVDTTLPRKGWKRILAYIGPAYLVSVGYMDPGNWATDLQGGAKFGYQLIWVLLMSNLMALLLQSLSARLGIVRRRDLAQANRETYPPLVNFCLYILAELAIAACDLAEVLGMAIGIHLLTGLPILWGTVITVLDTFLFLFLQRWGIRKLEAFIIALVAIIGMSFLVQILIAQPAMGEVVGGLVPGFLDNGALYIAVGIIGATVMPHNLYLHSALVQTRKINPDKKGIKTAIKYNLIDSTVALNAAFLVNTAILVLAATVFYKTGNTDVAKIQDAHHLLEPLLGSALAPILFAVALIAAGQSSTITGTMAGQIVMEGYLHLRINPWLRRLLTRLIAIVPAVFVIVIYGDDKVDDLLIFSQVILSLQLGFAVIPLIHFVSDKSTMGDFAIGTKTKVLSWLVAIILVFLNVNLVADETLALFETNISWIAKAAIVVVILLFVWLFVTMTFYPILNKKKKQSTDMLYGEAILLENLAINKVQKIAVALDFTKADEKLIAHALAQGSIEVEYQLIHIVESVSARYSNYSSDDAETRKDTERLNSYVSQLVQKGYKANAMLGYTHRVKEIVRLVTESKAEMLIMGAHRHSGLKDYVFGETIEDVRHQLTIPVLIVNVSEKVIPQ
ncbi:MAG: iron/manganese transporter [Sphingobacteriia bacterium 24-36-13]|jgi:manganese transport protein|uniref:Nramp family divalent metal transporter n=1 Tax=Sediminibacterium sp. TaxID=1917865 RepID=UPI000BD5B3E6|nr:Nramp family divalent metal transporter [Sediminibacterium sp.]OYY08944.1 MAG: iron/manganese transporter [Sphingobacteriia bacterium 35-36-14]OYZ52807.1 MAG: iron/manganese transporter [Sphingobacteriia bacterium 24-36-13]OZA62832.1 MAG: iron/manganese transporter [Sphingobacteriia bacterium 39-36-14]HQS24681.1 Nramp family divalent metal transporter [Sediminibacterium sp.]HQS36379.1 Nramp family divalent metal transporter [Sediminibacterium sp.]